MVDRRFIFQTAGHGSPEAERFVLLMRRLEAFSGASPSPRCVPPKGSVNKQILTEEEGRRRVKVAAAREETMIWTLLSRDGWGWSARHKGFQDMIVPFPSECRQRQPGNSGDFKSEPARGSLDRSLDTNCQGGIPVTFSQDLLTDPF